MKILAIGGSYRDGGITDQALELARTKLQALGAEVEVVQLREQHIQFCTNCRTCTQQPAKHPVPCVLQDEMNALVEKIEAADGYILTSPTNFYSVTALFKRFMERLLVYAYWPWGEKAPKLRKDARKPALIITSSAAPTLMAHWVFTTRKQLKSTARTVGAKTVGCLSFGLVAGEPDARLTEDDAREIEKEVRHLLA